MTSVAKQAKKDAIEYARAEMYFGAGAGTRRKLIGATVNHKADTIPGYAEIFDKLYKSQDMAKHAKKARLERNGRDAAQTVERNIRALSSGQKHNMTTGVAVVFGVAVVLNQTGMDKVVVAESKKQYAKARKWVESKRIDKGLGA